MTDYKTSLYYTKLEGKKFPDLTVFRNTILEKLKENFLESEKFKQKESSFFVDQFRIKFTVNYLHNSLGIILTFFPDDPKSDYWKKPTCILSIKETLEFCDLLGEDFIIVHDNKKYVFNRININPNSKISIDDWMVTLSSTTKLEQSRKLGELIKQESIYSSDKDLYEILEESFSKNNIFILFSDTLTDSNKEIILLSNYLNKFGTCSSINTINISKEKLEVSINNPNCIFIFIEPFKDKTEWYRDNKIYFASRNAPAQFIKPNTLSIKKFEIAKMNLIMEMLTKLNKKPIVLKPPDSLVTANGYLCLSDIASSKQRLFGALFTYSMAGIEKDESIHIYHDIKYTNNPENNEISFPEKSTLDELCERIVTLVDDKIEIDVILTKMWSEKNLESLICILNEKGITIKRVYFVSSYQARFVDNSILDNLPKTKNPYLIIDEKNAFIRSATDLTIYHTISQLSVKLLYPTEASISTQDLEKILWLVKKRLYRIQNFSVLKLPEPLKIFKEARVFLAKINERVRIPLRLLI